MHCIKYIRLYLNIYERTYIGVSYNSDDLFFLFFKVQLQNPLSTKDSLIKKNIYHCTFQFTHFLKNTTPFYSIMTIKLVNTDHLSVIGHHLVDQT